MTHTPGPWKADLGRVVRFIPESHGGPMTETVAICSGECEGSPLDNARLIAAAPEMFAALEAQQELERCRARCFTTGGADSDYEANMLAWSEAEKTAQTLRRAAIAKARGEQ